MSPYIIKIVPQYPQQFARLLLSLRVNDQTLLPLPFRNTCVNICAINISMLANTLFP